MNKASILPALAEKHQQRLWKYVRVTVACWEWQGPRDTDGYGQVWLTDREIAGAQRRFRAHRLMYSLYKGAIPDGLVLDHICRVRHCVNPDHLQPVSNRANILRGVGACAVNAAKTHCKHGHEFTTENTLHTRLGRACRTCARISDKKQYAKRKAGAVTPATIPEREND